MLFLLVFLNIFLNNARAADPPIAAQIPYRIELHGDVRVDPYFWLGERDTPRVLRYLDDENRYAQGFMADTQPLQNDLAQEMLNYSPKFENPVGVRDGNFVYYTRFPEGQEQPIFYRRGVNADAKEEVLIDANEEARGYSSYRIENVTTSPNGDLLAFAEDVNSRSLSTIRFKNLATGKILEENISDVANAFVWANDNKTIFYIKKDPDTRRARWIYRHEIGKSEDTLVFEESDAEFDLALEKSLTGKYIFVRSLSRTSSETSYLPAEQPDAKLTLFEPRAEGHIYEVKDGGDVFYIRSNLGAPEYRIFSAPHESFGHVQWAEVVAKRADTSISGLTVFKGYLVLSTRENGQSQIEIIDRSSLRSSKLKFADPVYAVSLSGNHEFSSETLRFAYESFKTPPYIGEVNMVNGERKILQTAEAHGFSPENYTTRRIFAKAADGAEVPISLFYRKGTELNRTTPVLIRGYGAYGATVDPNFDSNLLPLVDRGWVYAVAHVRGGGEKGVAWYEDGKMLSKRNSITDYIAATEHLHLEGISSPAHTYAIGFSAGGIVVGGAMNMRADLYNGVIADYPFVDVLTTMLNSGLPGTIQEYVEWGNPGERIAYEYIKSYAPYENVKKQRCNNLLVTTAYRDMDVGYWEPAKWVAKLRLLNSDASSTILLRTHMDAGHGGNPGRFSIMKEMAHKFAFLMKLEYPLP